MVRTATLLLGALGLIGWGCAAAKDPLNPNPTTTSGQGGWGGHGGEGTGGSGGQDFPCGVDCSLIETPECYVSECNLETLACTVVPAPSTTECDDGLFCTVDDHCLNGSCVGGGPNDCGLEADDCKVVNCQEAAQSCTMQDAPNGQACQGGNLCIVSGQCLAGKCEGVENDCLFSPLVECNIATCNPSTGQCDGTPDATKDDAACSLTGNLCMVNKTCSSGTCAGGTPKDCSHVALGCSYGDCQPITGNCIQVAVNQGEPCFSGIDQCEIGTCNANQSCIPSNKPNNSPCNDYDSCTNNDVCTGGVCGGTPIANCTVYFEQGFEGGCPPGGWTLNPDWQCGVPTSGPGGCYAGSYCLATNLAGDYGNNLAWASSNAQTPTINLASASEPVLSFWAWWNTEGYSWDGFNVKVSTDGGASWSVLSTVTPPYTLTIDSQQAWGGNQSAAGWQLVTANLSAYLGQQILLRFSFRSDTTGVRPGVYIDEVRVSEASAVPIAITTGAALPLAVVDSAYSMTLARSGGSSAAQWSIVSGSNHGWLSIGAGTGVLSGTPGAANQGPVSLTVRVTEPSNPSNFAERTFSFDVMSAIYFESFEGACPNGWTLGGDWQCGTPSTVGPATAFSGTRCLATQLAANYNPSQAWATTTATSPAIDLTGAASAAVIWRVWMHTEGSIYDGYNLRVSTDGGSSWQLVTTVTPAYSLTIDSQQAWGGNQSALGWQEFSANLNAFVGQPILLRFAFRSDPSVHYPGVYIDDVLVLQ